MKRITTVLPVVLAAAGLLAACSDESSTTPAAVVNGLEIAQQDLVDELEAIDANTEYREAFDAAAAAQGTNPIRGDEEGSFNTAFVAEILGIRIQYALLEAELADRGVEAEQACVDAASQALADRFAGASSTGDGEAILAGFGDDYAGYLLDRETDFFAIQAELSGQPCGEGPSDEAVEAYFEEHEDELAVETACVRHILVATPEEAAAVKEQLDGGADFEQLAQELSVDETSGQNGGDLGCGPEGQYVPEFEAAVFSQPVGVVGDPVQSEFGYHLIRVDERGVATLDDVRDDIVQTLEGENQQAFTDWFLDALAQGEVDVDPRYGTWDSTQAVIVRPSAEG